MSENAWPLPPSRVALIATVAAAALFRWVHGGHEDGLYWPDEIYQSLEPAHRLVYGYGLVAWEFVSGARNWALPGIIAGVLVIARAFGAEGPESYLVVVRGFFIALAAATTWGVHRLARGMGASLPAALAAACAFAAAGPLIYFGHRAMSEAASTLPVVLGFCFAAYPVRKQQGEGRRTLDVVLGASLLGIAVLLRLHNAVFCVALLGIFVARRNWRSLGLGFATLVGWALLYGLLDKLTWGGWFHSAFVYLKFNLIEGKASSWGTAPFFWYVRVLFRSMPLVMALLCVGLALSARRAPGLLLACAAFFLLHSYTPHKELRFVLPMMPLVCALAGAGIAALAERTNRTVGLAGACALAVAALFSGLRAHQLTFWEVGAYEHQRPKTSSAWGDSAEVNRLLAVAGKREDLCGLKLEAVHQAWSGGYTYLHREVPFYPSFGPPEHSGRFNYVIKGEVRPGEEVVARRGHLSLVRLRPDCVADPGFNWRLP